MSLFKKVSAVNPFQDEFLSAHSEHFFLLEYENYVIMMNFFH